MILDGGAQETLTLLVVLIAGVGLAADRFFSRRNDKKNHKEGNPNGAVKELRGSMHTRFDKMHSDLDTRMDRLEDKMENTHRDQTTRIVDAIKDGNKTVAAIKACTKAGTGCGGCVPLVTDILNDETKKSGEEVKTAMCPCFDYSRVQLAEIMRTDKIKSYCSGYCWIRSYQ